MNIYKTYEGEPTKEGFRIIFVHSSSKQEEDETRRQKRIEKGNCEIRGAIIET